MFASHRITRHALVCSAFLIAACAKKENAAVDTSSAAASTTSSTTSAAPAPAPANINLADVAGKWNMSAVPTTGTDTSPTKYVLTATNNTSGWTITFPGGKPIPVQVTTGGDSVIVSGTHPSARRKGVQVSTLGVLRLQNGDLVGPTTAHYKVKTPDSVLVLNVTGTRTR
ncbi:MAG TPA: hypothetical protein VJ840_12210 [Gemmatimonadaceae bacterium]|nr:hypothetical protein [Gemmatimonadaceae bacterium]